MSATDAQRDRVVTWRVALVGLVGVILAGVIGAGASYLTAHVQSDTQADQDQRSFLRAQRQAGYAKLLNDEVAAVVRSLAVYKQVIQGKSGSDQLTVATAANNLVATDAFNVDVIGSKAAASLADQIATVNQEYLVALSRAVSGLTVGTALTTSQRAMIDAVEKSYGRSLGAKIKQFEATARKDLGA